ncbi:hypothetical protein D3C76_1784920 [compost metagenome]
MVYLVAVGEQDHVGVLFNSPGLPQVGVYRPFVGSLLDATVQLRQGNYRAVEFFGERLERSGDLGNLVGTVFPA